MRRILISVWVLVSMVGLYQTAGPTKSKKERGPKQDVSVKQFDYPKEVENMSAIFRIELEPASVKHMQYNISPSITNCTIEIEYYISEWGPTNPPSIPAAIRFYEPDGTMTENMEFDATVRSPLKDSLFLLKVGEYKFEIDNKSTTSIIVDLVLSLNKCHSLKHKMHKNDLTKLSDRLGTLYKQHTSLINGNLADRHKTNNTFKYSIEAVHSKIYYGSVIESSLIVVLSLMQIFYMKRLLESKQLI